MSKGCLSVDGQKTRFEEIDEARRALGLPEAATLEEITARYRLLLKRWHPDVCAQEKSLCAEKTRQVKAAYKVLAAYCREYRFPFTREEVEKYISKEEWWMKRFGNDPVWGR